MEAGYVRDYKHNYLVLRDDRVLENNYQLKMIAENKVPGLLECQERMMNGEGLLYYDITSRQPISQLFDEKKVHFAELWELFMGLRKVCDEMERFLLYSDALMLSPEYVYLEVESRSFSFLYYPFEENETNLLPLLEFFMERVDSEDMNAVEAVYQMADMLSRGNCSMDEVLSWFFSEYAPEEEEADEEESLSECTPRVTEQEYEAWEAELYGASDTDKNKKKKKKASGRKHSGLWDRIKEFFFGKEDEEKSHEDEEAEYETCDTEESVRGEEHTVFIPWMENSEHKLYGVGKKNKYRIDLSRAPFTIGKLAGAVDVVLEDQSISRMHAKIARRNGRYYLTDMNSTNGCFHNGIRLSPNERVELGPGDEVGFGKLKFIYR